MTKDLIFVLVQFVLFAIFFIDIPLPGMDFSWPLWAEVVIISIGSLGGLLILMGIINLNENITPFPSPKRNSYLISGGVYRYVRHPIYAGIIIAMTAFGFYSGSAGRLIITAVLLVVFYFKSELEEKLLIERFPKYSQYKKATGRFFPKVWGK